MIPFLRRSTLAVLAVSVALVPTGAVGDASPPVAPAKGDVAAPFVATAVDGQTLSVDYAKPGATVLLFFLSSCPTCHRMLPEWNRAYARRAPRLRVIGVLMDREPPGFFSAYPVAFPVVRAPNRAFLSQFKVARAPTVIRIAAGGKVEDFAVGLTDPIRTGEIFRP